VQSLRSQCAITAKLLHNRCVNALLSLRARFAIAALYALQSLRVRFPIAFQSPRARFVTAACMSCIASRLLHNRSAIASQSLCITLPLYDLFTITLRSLYHHFTIILPSLYHHFTITSILFTLSRSEKCDERKAQPQPQRNAQSNTHPAVWLRTRSRRQSAAGSRV
jgi:hypothetical protein